MNKKKAGKNSSGQTPSDIADKPEKEYAKTLANLMTKRAVSRKLAEPDHPVQISLADLAASFTPDRIAALTSTISEGGLAEFGRDLLYRETLSSEARKLAYSMAASLSELRPEILNRRDSVADALDIDGQPATDPWFRTMSRIDRATARRGTPGNGTEDRTLYDASYKFEAMKLFLPGSKEQLTCEAHAVSLATLQKRFPCMHDLLDSGKFTESYPVASKIPNTGSSAGDRDSVIRFLATQAYIRQIEDSQRAHAFMPSSRKFSVREEIRGEVDGSQKMQMGSVLAAETTLSQAIARLFDAYEPQSEPDEKITLEGRPSAFIQIGEVASQPVYDALDKEGLKDFHIALSSLKPVALDFIAQSKVLSKANPRTMPGPDYVDPKADLITHWFGVPERTLLLLIDIRLLQSRVITQSILDDPSCLIGQNIARFMHPASMNDRTGIDPADPQRLCREMISLSRIRDQGERYRPDDMGDEGTGTTNAAVEAAYTLLGEFEERRASGTAPMSRAEGFFNHFDPLRKSPKPKKVPVGA